MHMLAALWQLVVDLLGAADPGALHLRAQAASQLADLQFFREINSFLTGEINVFRDNLLGRTVSLIGGAVMALVTLWIMVQGYRIAVGRSRDSMMELVMRSMRAAIELSVSPARSSSVVVVYVVSWSGWFLTSIGYHRQWDTFHPGEGIQWLPAVLLTALLASILVFLIVRAVPGSSRVRSRVR